MSVGNTVTLLPGWDFATREPIAAPGHGGRVQAATVAGFCFNDQDVAHAVCVTGADDVPAVVPDSAVEFHIPDVKYRGLNGYLIVEAMLTPLIEGYLFPRQAIAVGITSMPRAGLNVQRVIEAISTVEWQIRRVRSQKALRYVREFGDCGLPLPWHLALGAALATLREDFHAAP